MVEKATNVIKNIDRFWWAKESVKYEPPSKKKPVEKNES